MYVSRNRSPFFETTKLAKIQMKCKDFAEMLSVFPGFLIQFTWKIFIAQRDMKVTLCRCSVAVQLSERI